MSMLPIKQPHRVLVIEDDDSVRELISACLSEEHYHVLPSNHLLDSADVLQLRPDLILLDLILAGENVGWDYVRQLKSVPCTARLPILVCSGDYPFADHQTAEELSRVTGMLVKPIDVEHLLQSVKSAIAHGHTMAVPAPSGRSLQRIGTQRRADPRVGRNGEHHPPARR